MEVLEVLQRRVGESAEEPLLDLIHGFPGTGKSKVIQWMRTLMEDGLGWEHGVQYQCLATRNTMVALVGSSTMHSWKVGLRRKSSATDTSESLRARMMRIQ